MEVKAVAKLGVVIVARLLDLAWQGLVGHLARGIAVVSNLARFRSVAEGERLLPRAISLMSLKLEGMISETVEYTPPGVSSAASHAPQAKNSVGSPCRGDFFVVKPPHTPW
tara:strand:+ start:1262 stop:1594 length:333 start_codon:yes stop_codon:yes gene_type:complete